MSAPNLLRVGTTENIFVECQDCKGVDISVDINVMNHPTKTKKLASTSVTLTSAGSFQMLGKITVNEILMYMLMLQDHSLQYTPVLLTQQVTSLLWFQIPAGDFSKDPNEKQYVYLQAAFPGRVLEKVVLVSFQSGYIFIQTDKTIYTPSTKGDYSALLLI